MFNIIIRKKIPQLHSEWPNINGVFAIPSATGLQMIRKGYESPPMQSEQSHLISIMRRLWFLTLQICLIIAQYFRCRRWRFCFVKGQVSLAWSIALCTQGLYTQPRVLKERWREERTGSNSLNFFQAVFTCVGIESSKPPPAESMSPR